MKINKEVEKKWAWGKKKNWPERTKAIASAVPRFSKVIELGGGYCHLKEICPDLEYISADREKWTDLTIVADLNKELPDLGIFDVIICQGIIEYIDDVDKFLDEIKKYGRRLIVSYYYGENNTKERKNFFKIEDFGELLVKHGWKFNNLRSISNNEFLFTCINL